MFFYNKCIISDHVISRIHVNTISLYLCDNGIGLYSTVAILPEPTSHVEPTSPVDHTSHVDHTSPVETTTQVGPTSPVQPTSPVDTACLM